MQLWGDQYIKEECTPKTKSPYTNQQTPGTQGISHAPGQRKKSSADQKYFLSAMETEKGARGIQMLAIPLGALSRKPDEAVAQGPEGRWESLHSGDEISPDHEDYKPVIRNLSRTRDWFQGTLFFHWQGRGWFWEDLNIFVHRVLYLHYYYTSSTSDYQASDPRDWVSLLEII